MKRDSKRVGQMGTMGIKRISSNARGRSDSVAFNGMAFLVAYDPEAADGIDAQTRNNLRFLVSKLSKVRSAKTALLQVTVFRNDMTMKLAMDEVWCDWIGSEENWLQRACVGADLGDDVTRIEITAIAARA